MVGQRTLQEIGQTGIPVVNCSNACATGATAFREAWTSIKAGLYDVVLAVGVEQMGTGLLGGAGAGKGIPKEGLLGSGTMPAVFAQQHGHIFDEIRFDCDRPDRRHATRPGPCGGARRRAVECVQSRRNACHGIREQPWRQ